MRRPPDQGRTGVRGAAAALAVAAACLVAGAAAAGPGTAAASIDSLRTALAAMPPDTNRVLALHRLAVELYGAHSDSALAPALEAEQLARRHNFWRGIMLGLYAQGLAHWGGGRYEAALTKYAQALELAVALGADAVRFRLVNNMGVACNVMGDQAAALKAYQECLDLAPRAGAERQVPLILMNIGNIYAYVDDYERALEYYRRGVEGLDDPRSATAASLWKNMADMNESLGRPDEAVRCARRSLAIRDDLGDPALVASGRAALARAMLAAGRVDTASAVIDAALPDLRRLPDGSELVDGLVVRAGVDLAGGDADRARAVLAEAAAVERSHASPRQRREIYRLVSRAEHALGHGSEEARYAQAYVALVDSLSDMSRVREIARLAEQYDARVQVALVEQKRRSDARFFVVTTVGVLLLLLTLGRLYQVQKRLNRSLNLRNDALEREVAARTDELSALSQHLVRLREDERRRIARDIHDDLSQSLTAIRLSIGHVHLKNRDAELGPVLDRTAEMATAALKASSRLIRDLRPLALEELGLAGALQWLAEQHGALGNVEMVTDIPEVRECSEECRLALFRITQEALQNVHKHARARRVTVRLAEMDGGLSLAVVDDGCGFGAPSSGRRSYGVLGMQEAARAVGGTVSITSGPGEGTQVHVMLPC